jgi:peptide/nickel transport system permease protein
VVTLVALGVPTVFAGALITEQIFAIPGIGALLISAINNSDTPVVMGATFIFAVLVVLFNLVADVLYGVLDPRIRYG